MGCPGGVVPIGRVDSLSFRMAIWDDVLMMARQSAL
jgi:hypothetical protein